MAPNNFEFDFKQMSFNPIESPDGKTFQDDRDPDLNYFENKYTTYIHETDIENFLYMTQRF